MFVNCPSDIVINLDPGLCTAIVSFDASYTDNCPLGDDQVPGIDTTIVLGTGFGLSCSFGAQLPPVINHYFKVLDPMSPGQDVQTSYVRFMTSSPIGTTPQGVTSTVQARLYTLTDLATPYDVSINNRVLIGTGTPVTVPAGTLINERFNIPVSATIPAGQPVLVELEASHAFVIATPDNLFNGDNWWLGSDPCAISPDFPQTATQVGFPGTDLWVALGVEVEDEPEQTAGLPSGSEFPIGETEVCFTATDASLNTNECCFTVTINEYANPTSTLACNDNVQVSLDDSGCATIGADMILEGGPYGCYDDYIVDVVPLPGEPNNVVCCSELGGPWTVMVEDPDTGNKCWGSIIVEDKIDPTIECEDYVITCTDDLDDVLAAGPSSGSVFFETGPYPDIRCTKCSDIRIPCERCCCLCNS